MGRDAVRGSLATFARFSAFAGSRLEQLPRPLQDAARFLRDRYDMRDHTRTGVPHAMALPDEFVDWFGVAGPVATVLPRLQALRAVGLDYLTIIPGSAGMPREEQPRRCRASPPRSRPRFAPWGRERRTPPRAEFTIDGPYAVHYENVEG